MEIRNEAYVDSTSENDRSRRDMCTVFNDQCNEFQKNELAVLASVRVNRNPLVEEVAKRIY